MKTRGPSVDPGRVSRTREVLEKKRGCWEVSLCGRGCIAARKEWQQCDLNWTHFNVAMQLAQADKKATTEVILLKMTRF